MITAKELREGLRKRTETVLTQYEAETRRREIEGYAEWTDHNIFRTLDKKEQEYILAVLEEKGFDITYTPYYLILRW